MSKTKLETKSGGDGGSSGGDAKILAEILTDVVERRRNGETPRADDYAARHPHLRRAIEENLELVALLEESAGVPACPRELGAAIEALPQHLQRAIVLRSLKRRRWIDVAQELGLPELELRRQYARTIKDLLLRLT
jgi:DNA-directed RNA polymerase specialized sigma24 family protein